MRALVYLSLRSFRNRLLQLVKKPGQLIVLLLCLGMIGFVLFTPRMEGARAAPAPSASSMPSLWACMRF